ncbi:MAG: SMC-Scp complex subunit ScpB [Candidatus Micrarchaeia archaeon]
MQNPKGIIEASLFISARELKVDEIKKICGIKNEQKIIELLKEIQNEYLSRNSAIEICENEGKYIMKIKNEYAESVRGLAQDVELGRGAIRVLSFINMNDGNILKSVVAKKLGPSVYPYIKELVDLKFIEQKSAGRTKRLILTEKFRKYFSSAPKE